MVLCTIGQMCTTSRTKCGSGHSHVVTLLQQACIFLQEKRTALTLLLLGTVCEAYIEWGESIFKDSTKDVGEARYKLSGTPHTFEVGARNTHGFNLQVKLKSIATTGNPKGSIIQLGWKRDGVVYFILSGTEGQFASSNPPIAWMQSNLSALGHRSLRHLCIPGSHNSAMSCFNKGTLLPTVLPADGCIITQRGPISSQLELGVRYLDCRPVMKAGCFVAGYYSDQPLIGWQGSFIIPQ